MVLFEEIGLDESILKAIKEIGFESPTPIQEKTIPAILESRNDVVALAQTGTGKTAAFGLPLIQLADVDQKDVQALILSPTRELAIQIAQDLTNFSKYIKGFDVIPVYGGASIETQIRQLKKGAKLVVGTPGRVKDLIKRKILKVHRIDWLVLDEADEMLNMGFKDDLDEILEGTPVGKQTLLFSATMPKEIARIANTYMNNPSEISVGTKNSGAENVVHEYYAAHARNRYEVLKRIADMNPNIYGIVFCRTRQETKDVAEKFMTDGYNADALHGDLSQAQRDHVMSRFRSKHLQMLVATDVAARGLDVNDLTHVINYNLPDDLEAYIHRSGRTGRAGKSGTSISIVHTREMRKIRDLERISKKSFSRKMIPAGDDICKKQLFTLIDKVEKVELNNSEIDQFLPEIYKKLEWLSREDLIKHFVSVEFNRFLAYYKDAPDLNVDLNDSKGGRSDRKDGRRDGRSEGRRDSKRGGQKGFSRFYINVGSENKLKAARLIGLINENTRDRNIEIGKIDIMKKFAFFEVEKAKEDLVLKSFKKAEFEGVNVSVQLSKPDSKKKSDGGDGDGERRGRPSIGGDRSSSGADRPAKRKRKRI